MFWEFGIRTPLTITSISPKQTQTNITKSNKPNQTKRRNKTKQSKTNHKTNKLFFGNLAFKLNT